MGVMGTQVLAVEGDRSGVLRVYAHARDAALQTVGVVALNLGAEVATATIDLGPDVLDHTEFRLASFPEPADVEATDVTVNGEKMSPGLLPELQPIAVPGVQLVVAPRSITFAQFSPTQVVGGDS